MAGFTLSRRTEFEDVLRQGKRRAGERLILYVSTGEGPARAGFVCGRAVGGAVARNRARRILREAWRSMSPTVPEGVRAVIVARPEIREARMQDVRDELARLLGRAGVLP